MTLPSVPPLSASQINVELGRSANAPFDINRSAERALAQVPSGPISFSDFLGKSAAANYTYLGSYSENTGSFTINLGTSFSGRSIVLALGWSGTSDSAIASASIAGVSASIVQDHIYSSLAAYSVGAAILTASPSGTTGALSISLPNIIGIEASVWSLKSASVVGTAHKSAQGTGATGVSASIQPNTVAGGMIVEGGAYFTPGVPSSNMWSGQVSGVAQSSGMPRLGTAVNYNTPANLSFPIGVSVGQDGSENDTLLAVASAMSFSF